MRKDFFEVQTSETRRIWLVVVPLFGFYFGFFFLLALGLVRFFAPSAAHPVLEPLVTALALAILILAVQLWFADRHGVRVILDSLSAKDPDPEDTYHQRLVRVVEELGAAAGGVRARAVVVPTLAANAFALADSRQAVIGVTEGIVSRLSREQTQAVVAHELAHIVNRDCRLATLTCAMVAPFVALAEALEDMGDEPVGSYDARQEAAARAGGFASRSIASLTKTIVTLLQVAISRKREQRADAKAIELTRNPVAMAEAIYRIAHADHFLGGSGESLSPIFILPSRMRAVDQDEGIVANLFSSHPPIEKRLRWLAEMAHADLDALARGADARPQAAPARPLQDAMAATQQWMLRAGEQWTGPFLPAQLAAQAGFGLQSWVRRVGVEGEGEPAVNDPLISRFLRQASAKQDTALGDCPRCRTPLDEAIYEGIPIARCSMCGGVLVSEARVKRVLARREMAFSEAFLREVDGWLEEHAIARGGPQTLPPGQVSDACACPSCGREMLRQHYNYQYFIPVDRCFDCKRIWFDNRELEMLQAIVERRQDRHARPNVIPRPNR